MTTGIRKETVPACSETPAPAGLVVLAELLWVSVAMVVVLGLEVEFLHAVGFVMFWETTCVDKHIANTITPS